MTKPPPKREPLVGPPGTAAKLKRLAALLTDEKGVPVNMRTALSVAVDETLAKYERRAASRRPQS
jgi:hypothetical protein